MTGDKTHCRWIYRPGFNGTHWAMTTCKKGFNYLSKINNPESHVGCADAYNNRQCPICGRPIQIDYVLIEEDEI